LAALHGARVIATASPHNREFVANLGAEEVMDYHNTRFEEQVHDLDVVFDTVGGDTLDRSWSVLRPGGRMVTIAADGERSTDGRVRDAFFIVEANQKQLAEIGDLLGAGRLRPVVDSVVPLPRAADAFAGRVPRSGRGKVVVAIAASL
jgi:NADPH:quinone reductase-like Zn-dependent oxidoreductase